MCSTWRAGAAHQLRLNPDEAGPEGRAPAGPARHTNSSLTSNLTSGSASETTWSGWPNPGGADPRVDQRGIGGFRTLPVWLPAFFDLFGRYGMRTGCHDRSG